MQVVPARQLVFDVTFDSPSLFVGLSVYRMNSGTPVLISGPIAMGVAVGNTYWGSYTPTDGDQLVVLKAVYTDSGLTSVDPNYLQSSESLVCVAAQSSFKKNTALAGFPFPMFDLAGNPKTGLTIVARRSIDGGVIGACSNAAVEVSEGIYKIDLSASDLNGNSIAFKMTATGAGENCFTVVTQ